MSSRRFGGAHSPGAADRAAAPEPPALPGRFWAAALFAAPAPLLPSIFGEILRGAPLEAGYEIACGMALLLGAELLREGRKAEAAWMARASAARPALPRKIIAALLCGLGTGALAAWPWGLGIAAGAGYGILCAALHLVAFGIDPLSDKGFASDARRAETAIAAAETMIAETLAAARRLGDRGLEARVQALMQAARPVLRRIEEDPRELPRARRFLSVALTGARDATLQYARLGLADPEMHAAYSALLGELEKSFAAARERLSAESRDALEIEIEVLTERLARDMPAPMPGHAAPGTRG